MYEHLLLRHGEGLEEPAGDDELAEREASLAYLLGAAEQRWRVEMLVGASNQPVFALQQLTAMLRVAFDRGLITNIRALIATHSSVEKARARCLLFVPSFGGRSDGVTVPFTHRWYSHTRPVSASSSRPSPTLIRL